MSRGRPRTPTKILQMRGSFKVHPERAAARAEEPVDLPDISGPPASFTGEFLTAWNDIVSTCARGVLKESDRLSVEIASRLLAKFRVSGAEPSEKSQLIALLGKFGMNPSERSKVSGGSKKKENKFSALG